MNKPILAGHNELAKLDSGVWVKADETERSFIDYTDGVSTEDKVYAQVEAAQDRSVFSEELDRAWGDWALEYHLGSKRSNIYRGLNLENVKTVLEVGCGCGAITRFLGEQGFQVDSIEGTMRRAEIARLRTADLENVQIVSSNYHDLVLPESRYDLVVFTGVLEYSGAYAAEGVSPEAQLEMTLRHAQEAITPEGQVLIAIENRTGFKYLAGASEDHLNVSNIGLLGYPEPLSSSVTRGIRTWSKQQWRRMLEDFGFSASEFCYPFPDYKVPDAILSDHFLSLAAYPDQVLGGIGSRDYFTYWVPNMQESIFWRTASEAGCVDEFANSFLIVAGRSEAGIRAMIDFDFVRFASVRRKPGYRMQVIKKRAEAFVRRLPLVTVPCDSGSLLKQHHIKQEPFVDGQILESIWLHALSVVPTYEEFACHFRRYSTWLDGVLASGTECFVDALPRNVIVDDQAQWHLIDQEWHAPAGIDKETILFRALFYFALNAQDALADMEAGSGQKLADGVDIATADIPLISTLDDFVSWGFSLLSLDYSACRQSCLQFEAALHEQVSLNSGEVSLQSVLDAPIGRWKVAESFEFIKTPMEVRVFWTQLDKVWHLDHSACAALNADHGLHTCVELPEALTTHRYVRIDPAAYALHAFNGWLTFTRLSVIAVGSDGGQTEIYSIETASELFQSARLTGMRLLEGERIFLTSPRAQIVLDLEGLDWGRDVASVRIELEMDISRTSSGVSSRQVLRDETQRAEARARLRQLILDQQSQRIEEAAKRLALLEKKIEQGSTTVLGRLLGRFGLMRKYKV